MRVTGGELDAHEVRKTELEVNCLNKMQVFEWVLFDFCNVRMQKESIKVR